MNVRLRFLGVVSLAALVSSAAPLAAQSVMQPSPSSANAAVAPAHVRGPSTASARVAAHRASTTRGAPPVLQNRTSNRNAVALMIVGGAALVIGAVIGDDAGTLVMLGGAAVGLYGLYMFLT
jgi:hypothetical protein